MELKIYLFFFSFLICFYDFPSLAFDKWMSIISLYGICSNLWEKMQRIKILEFWASWRKVLIGNIRITSLYIVMCLESLVLWSKSSGYKKWTTLWGERLQTSLKIHISPSQSSNTPNSPILKLEFKRKVY